MLWKLEWVKGKWSKVPKRIDGYNAKSTDPETWTSFEAVREAYDRGGFDGIGFALGDGFVGIDLDDARDPESGAAHGWADEIIRRLGGYCEVSPSGTGFKIFTSGVWHGDWSRKPCESGEVEAYDHGRYFAVTGVSP